MNLSGNTILVTGGSAGIGLTFAKKFVELSNEVIITGRNEARLADAKRQEPALHTLQCDAGDPEAVARLGIQMRERFPKLNVLMNNAGVYKSHNLAEPLNALEELTEVTVNIGGPIRTVSALIDQLKRNRGTIINVSSGLAFVPLYSAPIYCATKAALHSYTQSLRLQLADRGVEVVELMPPAIRTDMTAEMHDTKGIKMITTDELLKASLRGLKSGRAEIRPGQANALYWMSRIAPGFIRGELTKNSKRFIPAPTAPAVDTPAAS